VSERDQRQPPRWPRRAWTEVLTRNILYKLLALGMAILLWAYASGDQAARGPERVFDNVPVRSEGLKTDLFPLDVPGSVQVTLRGNVEGLAASDIAAVVDLSAAKSGEASYPVQVYPPRGVAVVSIKPARLTLRLDRLAEKQVPVEVTLVGQVKEGMLALTPIVQPSQVVLRGGESVLAHLSRASVSVDLKGGSALVHESLPVRINERVEGAAAVQAQPAVVEVTVPVVRDRPAKQVPIQAVVTGSPATGFRSGVVRVEPETVKVIAAAEILAGLEKVATEPVSLQGAQGKVAATVRLVLPPGAEALEPQQAAVLIEVTAALPVRDFSRLTVKAENLGAGLELELKPAEVDVQVAAAGGQLSGLESRDLQPVVDLAGLQAGEHRVPVKVRFPAGIEVERVTPSELTAVIR